MSEFSPVGHLITACTGPRVQAYRDTIGFSREFFVLLWQHAFEVAGLLPAPDVNSLDQSILLYRNKKVKSWLEGSLVHHPDRRKVVLYDDRRTNIDSIFLKASQAVGVGDELELERHLVMIEALGASPTASTPTMSAQSIWDKFCEDDSPDGITDDRDGVPPLSATAAKTAPLPDLYFPGLEERLELSEKKLVRKRTMPLRFETREVYRSTLVDLVMEHLQVSLFGVAVRFNQIAMSSAGRIDDGQFRRKGVAHYSNMKLRPFEVRDERAMRFQPSLQARRSNFVATLSHKEHSSAYSRDDIWVLSPSPSFEQSCLLRSYFYGPSAAGAIEARQWS
nr:hypothetical protein HK105_005948 [Polyrhizophydium stewartii]